MSELEKTVDQLKGEGYTTKQINDALNALLEERHHQPVYSLEQTIEMLGLTEDDLKAILEDSVDSKEDFYFE